MDPQQPPNPYQPPTPANYDAPPQVDDIPYPASLGRRFGNFIIDGIVLGVVSSALVYAIFSLEIYFSGFGYAPQFLAYVVVYVIPEAVFGRTVGKLCTGTKVINLEGHKPTIGQVLARTVIRWIPFEPFSFLWGDPTGWHDRWSKTLVVPNRDPYADIV